MDGPGEHQEPMDVNSGSDSSSSDDDEQEQALISRAEELERQISDNKYLYDAHEELVKLYRQLGDLTSMRLAYERFHEYFPLTPQMWLAWINDEKKLANSESEVKNVYSLFDKAVEDYLSVNLWVEYAQYSLGKSGLEETRQIVERGLTAAGLNTAEGHLLWDTLREIELAHLSLTPEGTDQWKEQVSRIVEVFRRQLSVPLLNMEETYNEWKQFLEQVSKDHEINQQPIEWGYNKALKTLESYKPFELKLLGTTDEVQLLEIYREYIKTLTDPSTILCVYERAAAQLCLNTDIWMDYCIYALKLGELADKISLRSLRNCPWSEELWVMRLRILEQLGKEESEIMSCFELGISNLDANRCTEFWLTYLEYVNRNSDNKEKLYKNFDQALELLQFQDEGFVKVTRWYARILAKNGDMAGARRLWKNNILKKPQNKNSANLWLEFANLERQYGESNQLRNLFQRALTNCTDWPQYIAEEWLMFERENGKLSDVMKCIEKRNEVIKKNQPKETQVVEQTTQKGTKRKLHEENQTENKKHKVEEAKPLRKKVLKDPTTTIFVSNLHTNCNEKRLKKVFPNAINIEIVYDRKGRSRCYGYVQFKMEEEVMHSLARDRELVDGRPIFISNCKPDRTERKAGFKYSADVESNKLFLKGLPIEHTEEDLEKTYKKYGCKTVRLVRRRDGTPKGLAYVEFENDESAQKAMKETDQMKIGEHTVTVAISAPPQKQPAASKVAATPMRHARSKLQMPLIPRALQVKSGTSNGEEKSVQPKTNADFRNMLLNK